jgi:hypothetical protein
VVAAKPLDLMIQLCLGLGDGAINCQLRNPKPANHPGVEQLDPTFGNGTNTQFGMLWRTNFAHDQQVKLRRQCLCDLGGNRHATAWQRKHYWVSEPG